MDESDIGQVKAGQAVAFSADAFPDRQFKGVVEQVRLAATTANNVVTYPVIVTVDNSDGTLLPGLTVNAEIEVSKRANVLKLGNAALRFKPSEGSPLADLQAAGPGRRRNRAIAARATPTAGDLQDLAGTLGLDAGQKAAFDAALEQMRQRQAERMAQTTPSHQAAAACSAAGRASGLAAAPPDASDAGADARARMRDRFNQQFAAFVATLDDAQKTKWNAALEAQLSAKRVTIYKLADGKPEATTVRLGASDSSSTEVSGRASPRATWSSPASVRRRGEVMAAADAVPVIRTARLGKSMRPVPKPKSSRSAAWTCGSCPASSSRSGPSGSGKSTLMNLIGCPDTPTSGEYHCDGVDVATLDAEELATLRREKIGFVFRGFHLLPRMDATDNVAMPLGYARVPRRTPRGARWLRWHRSAWPNAPRTGPTNFPAASSSAWPSPARWSTIRRSCSPTNPPARWIRRPARILALFNGCATTATPWC